MGSVHDSWEVPRVRSASLAGEVAQVRIGLASRMNGESRSAPRARRAPRGCRARSRARPRSGPRPGSRPRTRSAPSPSPGRASRAGWRSAGRCAWSSRAPPRRRRRRRCRRRRRRSRRGPSRPAPGTRPAPRRTAGDTGAGGAEATYDDRDERGSDERADAFGGEQEADEAGRGVEVAHEVEREERHLAAADEVGRGRVPHAGPHDRVPGDEVPALADQLAHRRSVGRRRGALGQPAQQDGRGEVADRVDEQGGYGAEELDEDAAERRVRRAGWRRGCRSSGCCAPGAARAAPRWAGRWSWRRRRGRWRSW